MQTLGWRESVRLPGFGIRLAAKLDTGALSSVLHAEDVEITSDRLVRFRMPLRRDDGKWAVCQAPLLEWREVRDSGGHPSVRPVIRCAVELAGEAWEEEFTLFPRNGMRHRILLGRRALAGRFLVDPSRVGASGRGDAHAATLAN